MDDLPESEYYRVLAAQRRRVALDVLAGRTAPVDLEELAAAIAARELDGGDAGEGPVRRTAISLHHVHLPMLSETGVIDYDPGAGRVEACPRLPGA